MEEMSKQALERPDLKEYLLVLKEQRIWFHGEKPETPFNGVNIVSNISDVGMSVARERNHTCITRVQA